MLAGDEFYSDDVTSGVEPPVSTTGGRTCQPCVTCGIACAKTDDGECWECSTELGEAGA